MILNRDSAIAAAGNLRGLIAGLRQVDPVMAQQLTGKALVASKSPWGTLAAGIVGWAAARWGFDLDANETAIVAGACVVAGSYAMRAITRQPITGLVKADPL